MPANRRPDPEPVETDDVAIITAGTVLWALALVVLLVLRGRLGEDDWIRVTAAGTFLGLLGIRYVRRRRAARAASGTETADRGRGRSGGAARGRRHR